MNWVRSKLRAWLDVDFPAQSLWDDITRAHRKANGAFTFITEQAKQLEQQQREICALRGEVAMLKANQQADTVVLTGRGRNVPISISGLNR